MTRSKTRTVQLKLMVTPEEKVEWNKKAAAVGLDLSNYIRRCIERRQLPKPQSFQSRVNLDTYRELGKIGVNLNQQIRAMNTALASGQHIPNVEESLATVEEVHQLLKQIQLRLLLGGEG